MGIMKPTILCVDDEIDNVQALERIFRQRYTVLKATSGHEALVLLDQYPEDISVIITDQRMPEMTGVQFLSHALEKRPNAVRILLTGYTDLESVISAVNNGQIFRYLTKPWDPIDLQNTVNQAAEKFQLKKELDYKNNDLEKAYAELKTLDQAKSQFMILINHELKTPLTSIISFTELLGETKLNEEQNLFALKIKRSADRLRALIDDVLVIVGSETRTLKAKILSFDSKAIDLRLPNEISQIFQSKNQTLKIDIAEGKLLADQMLVSQIFYRLLHNAAKFGTESSEILLAGKLITPHRMCMSVTNKGTHISPVVIDKILKPFFIDEDVMNHSAGMGLGLTVCQALLKAHGSSLKINNVDDGVEVAFEIPCLK